MHNFIHNFFNDITLLLQNMDFTFTVLRSQNMDNMRQGIKACSCPAFIYSWELLPQILQQTKRKEGALKTVIQEKKNSLYLQKQLEAKNLKLKYSKQAKTMILQPSIHTIIIIQTNGIQNKVTQLHELKSIKAPNLKCVIFFYW